MKSPASLPVGGLVVVLLLSALGAASAEPNIPDRLSINPEMCVSDLDYAQVVSATITPRGDRWAVSATVRHDDTGWEHYADAFVVVNPATMEVLGTRVLFHPHVDEQPFTRSLSGLEIPAGIDEILVVARCNVHGFGGCGTRLQLSHP